MQLQVSGCGGHEFLKTCTAAVRDSALPVPAKSGRGHIFTFEHRRLGFGGSLGEVVLLVRFSSFAAGARRIALQKDAARARLVALTHTHTHRTHVSRTSNISSDCIT